MDIFWEIHGDIPREGPGDNRCTREALQMLKELPQTVTVLDVGCGPGMQTIELAKCLEGRIIALDKHQPFLDALSRRAHQEGVSPKITPMNGSMFALDFAPESFDLIWAEGSIYIIGFERGLREWGRYLKPDAYLAVTEISWLSDNIPEEPRKFWEAEYPQMNGISENINIIESLGYLPAGHFVLPESAWWEHYYTPLEQRIVMLKEKYKNNPEALKQLDFEQKEIDLYKRYSSCYGYVFYLMQKVDNIHANSY